MKYFFILLLTLFSLSIGYSQNTFDVVNSNKVGVSTEQASTANPWFVGSKLSFNLDEDQPLDESFLLSAKILNVLASGEKYNVSVVGVAGLGNTDVLNPESGLNLGLYSYYQIAQSGQFTLVVHGGVGYKVIEQGVGVGQKAPTQFKTVAGVEAIFMPDNGSSPATISVTPVYFFNTNSTVESTGGVEVTGVIPVGKGVGLLAEGLVDFNNQANSTVRLGIIVNTNL